MSRNARASARLPVYHSLAPGKLGLSALGIAALLALALPAAAQEAAQEGDLAFTFSADVVDLSAIPGGGDRQVSVFEARLVITETAAGPMERLGARCVGTGELDGKTMEFADRGSCTWQDAEGDMIFESFEDSGAAGAGTGKATLLGGTGKFAGISGGYDYGLAFVASPREGVTQWVGHKKGTWRIVTD